MKTASPVVSLASVAAGESKQNRLSSQGATGRMRLSTVIAALLVAMIVAVCVTKANATVSTITLVGMVSSGTDQTGIFGPANTNLTGQNFTLVYTFDDTLGTQQTYKYNSPDNACGSSIQSNDTTSPGAASLTIGSGTWTFGSGTNKYSRASRYVGACESKTELYWDVEDHCYSCTSTNTDYVSGDFFLPYGSIRGSEYNWADGLAYTKAIANNALVFGIDYPGQHASAYFNVTSITISGPQSGWTTSQALQFVPVTPCRIADTRNPAGAFGGPVLPGGSTREFDIPQSACSIPDSAVAYSLNVTAVPSGPLGYLAMWPSGQKQPEVSTLNSDGRVKANAAIIPSGSKGGVNVYVTNQSNVILDIDGYFVNAGAPSALSFYPVTPCRLADTRNAAGPLGGPFITGGKNRDFPVHNADCRLPSGAKAYSLNVTAVPHHGLGYLTLWPTGQTQPGVSTLNASTGAITANAAIVPAGNSGDISVFVSDDSDVILDVNGFFADPAADGLSLYATTPCRILDTRSVAGVFKGVLDVAVKSSVCPPPTNAQADVLNATVVPTGTLGYLSLYPSGEAQPPVSTLNAGDGAVTSNLAIVPTINGGITAFSSSSTQLIVDSSGYFAP
jgi:hypothetical protein